MKRLVRACQHIPHGFDGGLVDRAILREFREIMDKARWITPSQSLRHSSGFRVLQRAAMNFRAYFSSVRTFSSERARPTT